MKKSFIAIAAFALAACGGGQDAPAPDATSSIESSGKAAAITAEYQAILDEDFVLDGGVETPAADVIALLPDSMKLTIGASSFDAASGATIWTDVSLTGADDSSVGVTADTVELWGLNTDAIAARVAGENFDDTVKLAERIEASGVTTLGLDLLMYNLVESYIEGISRTVETFAPDEGISDEELAEFRAAMELVIDEYKVDIGRVVAINPKLRPWELSPIDPEIAKAEPDKAALLVVQETAAYFRAFGVDHIIWTDTEFVMKSEQDGIQQEVDGAYEFVGYSGWNGGDIESSVMAGAYFSQDMDMTEFMEEEGVPPEDMPDAFEKMRVGYSVDSGTFSGMKFDKVLRYVAMGEWPPTSEADLMAYGRLDMQDFEMSFNDVDLFSIDGLVVDFSKWHWFIPNQGEISFTGLTYDVGGFFDLIASMPEAQSDEDLQMMEQVLDIGKKFEAFPVIYDAAYVWDWNPETGAFSLSAPQKHHTFGEAEFEISGTLPNFEDSVAAFKEDMAFVPDPDLDPWEDGYRAQAWESLVEETFTVTGGRLVLDDQGGLDKLFPLIIEIGKLNPDEAGPMIANSTPDTLRQAAVSAIGFGAIEAGKELPPAENWFMSFADWVRDGGKFTLEMKPSEPLGAHLEEKYPDPSPDEIVEILGLTVTHETP